MQRENGYFCGGTVKTPTATMEYGCGASALIQKKKTKKYVCE